MCTDCLDRYIVYTKKWMMKASKVSS
jgi:hypothetical protein